MGFFQNTQKPKGFGGKLMVEMMNYGHAALATWGLSHLKTAQEWAVLDVGCGGGANISRLLKRCASVTGLDYSEVSVEKSKKVNAVAIQSGKCQIVQGDVSKLPFNKEGFDLVTAFETVYFWPGPKESLAEIYRVLKPGGVFFICNEADSKNAWEDRIEGMKIYTPEELRVILEAAGFSDIQITRKEGKPWFALTARKED